MKKTYEIRVAIEGAKEIKIPIKIIEEQLTDMLATASSESCGCAWWKPVDEMSYINTKNALIEELMPDTDDEICTEQIWARMLLNGEKLRLLDPESEWHWKGHKEGEMLWSWQIRAEGSEPEGGEWHDIGIEDILRGLLTYGLMGYANGCRPTLESVNDDGDFYDADAIIQIAMYGEVIYG